MGTRDPRVDVYIAKSADFARPVLEHLRALVHEACQDVEETMKWSFPHFDYKGMMCSMAAFKNHCSFGFWKASLMKDAKKFASAADLGMGTFGRITSIKDLPPKNVMLRYIKEAARLNDEGVKVPRTKAASKSPVRVPADLARALEKNKKAHEVFAAFSPSHKREYIEYITEAKRLPTRERRIGKTIELLGKGKSLNDKYESKKAK